MGSSSRGINEVCDQGDDEQSTTDVTGEPNDFVY